MTGPSNLNGMASDARVWVFAFDRVLDSATRDRLSLTLEPFLRAWLSHGEQVSSTTEFVEERFWIVAADCAGGVSGCATDALVTAVRAVCEADGLDPLDRNLVTFRNNRGEIDSLPRRSFADHVAGGTIGPGTSVFDTTVRTVAEFAARFELDYSDAWHARAFPR